MRLVSAVFILLAILAIANGTHAESVSTRLPEIARPSADLISSEWGVAPVVTQYTSCTETVPSHTSHESTAPGLADGCEDCDRRSLEVFFDYDTWRAWLMTVGTTTACMPARISARHSARSVTRPTSAFK